MASVTDLYNSLQGEREREQ